MIKLSTIFPIYIGKIKHYPYPQLFPSFSTYFPAVSTDIRVVNGLSHHSVNRLKCSACSINIYITSMSRDNLNETNTPMKRKNNILLPPLSESTLISPHFGSSYPIMSESTKFGIASSLDGYKLANYTKALEHQHKMSYRRQVHNESDEPDYEPLDVCGPNKQLKKSGEGIFLYLEFIQKLMVTMLLMSVVLIFPLLVQYQSDGLSQYSSSLSITLAQFSLGNLSNGNRKQYLIVTIADIVSMLIFFFFYVYWRSFHNSSVEEVQSNEEIVNPKSYALSVVDFFGTGVNQVTLERDLKQYLSNVLKMDVYEVEVVNDYKGFFSNIMEYDSLMETVTKEKKIIEQTKKSTEKLRELEGEVHQMEEELMKVTHAFEPIYAIIHFRTLAAKYAFLNHCKRFHLHDTIGQAIQRCLCCVHQPPSRQLFLQRFPLMIRSNNLSRPEEINWRNIDLSKLSIFIRWTVSLLLVIVSIAITSALIGICTLYVASTSSCQNVIYPQTTSLLDTQTASLAGGKALFCYCNAHLQEMYTNDNVGKACSNISTQVLMTNGLQIAASLVSTVTNVILSLIVTAIAKNLLRPNTIPKQHSFIFWGILISNFINSCAIPLILNARIFGMESIAYLKFLSFMDFSQMSVFDDFTVDWYAMISPYYLNMIIISAFLSPVISLLTFSLKHCLTLRKVKKLCENEDGDQPAIQKEVDAIMVKNQFPLAEEQSQIVLILFIVVMYSGLIPLMIPIFTVGLFFWYFCKRTTIVKFSVRIAADESLNASTLNIIPFMILAHTLFAVWSHTSKGIFSQNVQLFSITLTFFKNSLDRIFWDLLISGEVALIVLFLVLDYTLFNFVGCLKQCCKDELSMPTQYNKFVKDPYEKRVKGSHILASYKLKKSPHYGHAIEAYTALAEKNRMQRTELNSLEGRMQ